MKRKSKVIWEESYTLKLKIKVERDTNDERANSDLVTKTLLFDDQVQDEATEVHSIDPDDYVARRRFDSTRFYVRQNLRDFWVQVTRMLLREAHDFEDFIYEVPEELLGEMRNASFFRKRTEEMDRRAAGARLTSIKEIKRDSAVRFRNSRHEYLRERYDSIKESIDVLVYQWKGNLERYRNGESSAQSESQLQEDFKLMAHRFGARHPDEVFEKLFLGEQPSKIAYYLLGLESGYETATVENLLKPAVAAKQGRRTKTR